MNDKLVHRGPDAEGFWHDAERGVYLGHRRLAIVDITGGHQPMWTRDGQLGLVFNGEIYNHQILRAELKSLGYVFESDHSDTEVLLYGYRAWGVNLASRLNGMWAFALYDVAGRRLFCSRDRFGKKPFFYSHAGGALVFASELSAVLRHPCAPLSQSRTALRKYFAYGYIPAPHSLIEGVRKLAGGHSLLYNISTDTLKVWKYWDFVLEPFEHAPPNAEEAWAEELRTLLDKAVQRRLMSDVPLGAFVSGGIDSSAVAAFAARHVGQDRLKTFSIGFEEASFDESRYARNVAEHLGTEHYADILSMEKARALLPEVIDRLDEPMGDSSLLPTYLLCQHARRHVTVTLGGDGADELFAGYDPFRALRWAERYDRLVPRPAHAAIRHLMARLPVSHRYMSLDFKIKRTLRGLSYSPRFWLPVWMAPLAPDELSAFFGEPVDPEEVYSEAIEQWDACRSPNLIDKVLQFYTKLYLQDDILVKVDRAGMMHSLEVRSPFLDIELVDFARRIPAAYKFRHGQTKYLLKKALEPVLPTEILYRRKQGFGVPSGRWLKDESFFSGTRGQTFNAGFVMKARLNHRQNREDQRAFLWNTRVLSGWNR
ncbi:MAG: asparagine synthase (glutamine-hydrolyzing) [Methylococcaceae bacterium]|nr:asparagine synthase (glutamine-hydrolyzing) [Methylococcaceae bacterium]